MAAADAELREGSDDDVITAPVWLHQGFALAKHELAVACVLSLFSDIREWKLFTQLRRVSRVWLNASNVGLSIVLQVAPLQVEDDDRL